MYKTLHITPKTPHGWEELFEYFPDVARAEHVTGPDDYEDFTLFYKDSDEPFPLSCFRVGSWTRTFIETTLESL